MIIHVYITSAKLKVKKDEKLNKNEKKIIL